MKKYINPEIELLDMDIEQPLLDNSVTLDFIDDVEYNGTDEIEARDFFLNADI